MSADNEEWNTITSNTSEEVEDKIEIEIEGEETQPQELKIEVEANQVDEAPKEEAVSEEPQSGAQKRIRQLVRQKKEREEQISSLMARQQELEERLKNQQQEITTSVEKNFEAAEQQIQSRITMARDAYKQALESGDTDRIVQAQEYLSNAQSDASTLKITKQQYRPAAEQQVQQTSQPTQQQSPQYDKLAVEWAGKNPWFGQDNVMTTLALETDAELKAEGYDPTDEDFYQEIDARLRSKFPERFGGTPNRQQEASPPAQVVGGASRTSSSQSSGSGRKVKLSKEDLRLADKWGISLEQYAAEKLKVGNADGEYTSVFGNK
tara:strand:- start:1243 stop:2208 length:966 start_codon:yes stop_codon:yes gene_type:complete